MEMAGQTRSRAAGPSTLEKLEPSPRYSGIGCCKVCEPFLKLPSEVKSETDLKGDLAFPTRARGVAHPGAGGDSGHLRRLNLDRVLVVAMNRPDSFTRAELIEATGLSAPTVGSLVSHLIRSGVVRELGAGPS